MTRFRPRFSIRTLATFVTLACAYFGAWEATKRYGIPPYETVSGHELVIDGPKLNAIEIKTPNDPIIRSIRYYGHASSPMPFVICLSQQSRFKYGGELNQYFIWFFGYYHRLFTTK